MKKTFLILSFTFLFFFLFMPKDTYAESIYLQPDSVSSTSSTYIPGHQSFYYSDSNSYNAYKWLYSNKIGSGHYNETLDISFLIYEGEYNSGVSLQNSSIKPIVTVNNKVCTVTSQPSTFGRIDNSLSPTLTYPFPVFGVVCSNVRLGSSTMTINILNSGASNTVDKVHAITSTFDFTPVNSTSNIESAIDENTQVQEDIKDSITDSNTSESQSSAGSFFEDFKSDDYGLSDIITMPLTFIKGLSNASCYSLDLPFPFVDQSVQIPCMTSIYENYFGSFLTLYQTITTGFIAYWVCVNIYRLVKNFKNPDDDKVEVMEL